MEDQKNKKYNNRVLVIGGGIGGIKAAMDLAEAGKDVVLIDKAPSIGGLVTQLDRTFPTNNCDLCTLSPQLAESARQLHIELLTNTQLCKLEGDAGSFTATLQIQPRFIDLNKCTACGECLKAFPECVKFTPGLDHRAPTCMRYPQATPEAFSIDMEKCGDVESLVKSCKAGAIFTEDKEQFRDLEISSIVLALGADLFDTNKLKEYGHGEFPNVLTGLEYERILSASGPTQGILTRPSDGKSPKKIAWIQCVGSRNINQLDVPYCSSVCCMYALKEAIVTKERFHDDIETTVFYMDMRTFGKDYELYYQRAKDEFGIRFVRSRPHTVDYDDKTDNLRITYNTETDGTNKTEDFDMVILSTGFCVSKEAAGLSERLGIELNKQNFVMTGNFDPVRTSKPGIYVCGMMESPKDISETIVQASAAACMAARDLKKEVSSYDNQIELPPERDVSNEAPRIGVFICDCGENIGGLVNTEDLADYAKMLPQVVSSEVIGHGCSRKSLKLVRDLINENNLNRVVVGACSPRTHEALFQDTVRKAGLNKYLVEIANIRDQDTWVHGDLPEKAMDKSKDLIRMAVAASALSHPLTEHTLPMNKDVLVVGGGVTGMNASLNLAEHGYKVFLVERSRELGGVAKNIHKTLEGEDVQAYIEDLIVRTQNHELIQVINNAIIVDHSGLPGMFKTGIQVGPRMYYRQLTHCATIIATGALPNRPDEYLLGKHDAVINQLELDEKIEVQPDVIKKWKNVVMIQCVGSRTSDNPNCSRICCQSAVKNALRVKEINPNINLFILYRDIRTYGFQEDYYRKAREMGISFIRYEPDNAPEVESRNKLVSVSFNEPILGRKIKVTADCLALSTGFIADDESTEDLGVIFRIPRTSDGYFQEDHIKLRPVDLPVPGFFLAGTAHAPKSIRESIAQAQAAVGRTLTLLAKDSINLGAAVAKVDGNKCAACLICVRACPFDVPFINADGYSEIDPAKCHGCGVCAADCPAKAIQLMQYEDDQIMAKVNGLLEGVS